MTEFNEHEDLRSELESWEGDFPETWKPDPGAILTGTIVEYRTVATSHGNSPVVTIKQDKSGNLLDVWLTATVLAKQWESANPQPGDKVGIKYAGKHPDKGYHRYKLRVIRQ